MPQRGDTDLSFFCAVCNILSTLQSLHCLGLLGFEIAVWQGMIRDIFEDDAMYLLND
jgi:hypothetical protein